MIGRPLADMLEKEWQQQVVQLARTLGWRLYHTFDSRRSQPGFPDLVLIRDRVVYLELKREKGTLTEPQREWLASLDEADAEVYVARPSDLTELGRILATRGRTNRYEALAIATRRLLERHAA